MHNYDNNLFQILKVAYLMEFYITMVIPSLQTAPQGALAMKARGNVNLQNATVIYARLMPMDTFIHLMAPHMTTKEPVNMFWSHHAAMMIIQ